MALQAIRAFRVAAIIAGTFVGSALGAQGGGTSVFVAGVADAETGQPLEGAEILLTGEYRLLRANTMGEAVFGGVPRGKQHIRVRKIGYVASEVDVAIVGDTSGAVFRLQKAVTQLGAVRVEAEWVPPRMRDAQVRKRMGIGRFLTEADLDRDRERDFPLMLTTRFPGLKTVLDSSGHRVLASTRDLLGMMGVKPCFISVYLDDMYFPRGDLEMIRTWDLTLVEFYTADQVPVRYKAGGGGGCGLVLLWSKWN